MGDGTYKMRTNAKNVYHPIDTPRELEAVQQADPKTYWITVTSKPVVDAQGLRPNAGGVQDKAIQDALLLLKKEKGCAMDLVSVDRVPLMVLDDDGNEVVCMSIMVLATPVKGCTPRYHPMREYR
jgi:hypothetical protein